MYYTYIWRDANGVPFYVGKGKGGRAYYLYDRSPDFKEIHSRGGCTVEIADWFIHESQAHAHEVELIERYGRRDYGGTLVNKTDGGEGISGFTHRADTIAKMSEKAKMRAPVFGRSHTSATRKLIGSYHAGKSVSDSTRLKISIKNKGRIHTPGSINNVTSSGRLKPPNKNNKLGLKGVSLIDSDGVYRAALMVNRKQKHLGRFATAVEAARAYDLAAVEAWGLGNCYLNFPEYFSGMAA